MTLRNVLLASAAPLALSLFAPAHAAEAAAAIQPDPQTATSVGTGASDEGEIVVTARHRTESSQAVPLAISVVGGDHIDNTGAFNVGRLQQMTPALQFYSSNPRNTSVNVRGFGAPLGLTNDGIDQGVGIYVDDVYYSRVASSTFDFLDVAQIEVLRGPQGTLYGKNTTAGAINITSRQPTFEFEGRGEVTFGNYGYVQVKGAVSGPLSDTLALRVAGSQTWRNGTIHNIKTGVDDNNLENTGLRAQLLWKASNALTINLAGDYSHQDTTCCATVFVKYVPTQKALNRQYPALYDVAAGLPAGTNGYLANPASQNPFNRLTDVDGTLQAKQSIGGASLKAKLDLGEGTLTSISAWRFWDWDPSNDRDFTAFPITTVSQNPSKQRQFTQELRYNHHTSALDFQVGTFYYYQKVDTNGSQVQGAAATKWLLAPNASAGNPYNQNVINGLSSTNTIRLRNTSWSVYGQASWRPLPGLTIQPGARVNYDKKSGSYDAVVRDGAGNLLSAGMASTGTAIQKAQVGVLTPESYAPSFAKWNLSYDITVSYDILPDVHTYATYSKTFQTGGINLNGVPIDTAGNIQSQYYTVAPESVHHYEIGVKSQWWNRRATLNLAAFRTDIGNYQAVFSANNATSISTLRGYVANVPKVRSQGIEADFSVRPSERFNAYANFAYTDATYRDFKDAPPPVELSGGSTFVNGASCAVPTALPINTSPTSCDISGQRLPGVSKYSLSFGGEANLPVALAGHDGQVYLGADGSTRSDFSSNATPSAATTLPGYTLVNFRVGWRSDRDAKGPKIDVFGWVRNAFDKGYIEMLQVAPSSVGQIVGNLGDPRTFGGTLKVSF